MRARVSSQADAHDVPKMRYNVVDHDNVHRWCMWIIMECVSNAALANYLKCMPTLWEVAEVTSESHESRKDGSKTLPYALKYIRAIRVPCTNASNIDDVWHLTAKAYGDRWVLPDDKLQRPSSYCLRVLYAVTVAVSTSHKND